ncbi:uncharacterized protein AC631_03941 [Debaryomyces fabryi]|uniref:Uncharacterized protein n=1 Tax=Debaryomyces fabryi TaxID=58627 RepID=A0A0V1PVJ2_9ASCO|nr:uncharacterized protein AC631_03941 [Debaryomyces fabryi]KSA00279.1 hypothetical protein AC631_03941 [Debaryomyces fabryi]CUM49720.1 unnamed protein product [Debaryomyces fabryi]
MSSNYLKDTKSLPLRFEHFSPSTSKYELTKENRGPDIKANKIQPVAEYDANKISKTVKFINQTNNENVDIPWPKVKVDEDFEPSSKISELGRIFIHYLNEIGIIKADLQTPSMCEKTAHRGKQYTCCLKFQINYGFQRFQVLLTLKYGIANKKVFLNNSISNDELVDYLKNLIVFKKSDTHQELKFNNLKLLSVSCNINGLELEI